MTRRCGPSPTMVARSGTAGSRIARAPRSTPRVATGRLRETRRIADTTWTGRGRGPPPGRPRRARGRARPRRATTRRRRRWAPRMTGASPAAELTRVAAMLDTALSATPRRDQRPRWPTARKTDADRSMTQWNVAVTGRPASRATGTSSVANGLTTPRWACATSKPPASSRRRTSRRANGLTGMPPGSGIASRCTVTPSSPRAVAPCRSPSGPAVAVNTSTSCPAATRWRDRSRTWLSMPPTRGG